MVAYWLEFPLPVSLCFALIACSAWLNLFLTFRFPSTHRLPPNSALATLLFDSLQLAGLLYLTGGLTNPFALLLTVPVVISATTLSLQMTAILGFLVMAMASVLVFRHLPLPWTEGERLSMPFVYVAGMWMAVFSSITFTAVYAWRVAEEARLLANALSATELVLQREQHLSALDGLAAAAAHELGTPLATITVVAKEMERALGDDPKFREDVTLLRSQSERCRGILKRLASLSSEGEVHLDRLPLTSLIEEVIAPHRDFGIAIRLEPGELYRPRAGRTPQSGRHLRSWQPRRKRRRFRFQDRHGALALERRGRHHRGGRRRPGLSAGNPRPHRRALYVDQAGRGARRRPRPRPVHRQDAAGAVGRHPVLLQRQ